MSIKLKWAPIDNADIKTYKIHRSIIGLVTETEAPFGLISGDTLKLKINNQTIQVITFTGDLGVEDLVDFLNSKLEGAMAYKAKDSDKIYIRSNIRSEDGFIEVFGGTAISKFGFPMGTVSEKSSSSVLDIVDSNTLIYEDPNGVIQDYYALSVVDNFGNESKKTAFTQAIEFTGNICVVEGKVTDLQGVRKCDVEVTAKIVVPPEQAGTGAYVLKEEVSTITGEDGRFSLPLLQGASVIFEVNRARISDPVLIPEEPFVFFKTLDINPDYKLYDLV